MNFPAAVPPPLFGPPAAGWWRFWLDDTPMGWMPSDHVDRLRSLLGAGEWMHGQPGRFQVLSPAGAGSDPGRVDERSRWMQALARRLREAGVVRGWREELYRAESAPADGEDLTVLARRGEAFFRMERAAFRFFGLRSRAVHVNGLSKDGRLCCGRRALHKATDPGRLDNLAAGGLGADEDFLDCARRELWEEAGVPMALSAFLRPQGLILSRRIEPEGLHEELLHVFQLTLPEGFAPHNQDGEVSGFEWLTPEAGRQRIASGDFSPDAALVSTLVLGTQKLA